MDGYSASNGTTVKNQWWKWPLVPLASLVGASLAVVAFVLMQWVSLKFIGGSPNGWLFKYIVPVFASGVFGFAFIWSACQVAPRYKAITSIVMSTVLIILLLVILFLICTNPKYSYGVIILSLFQCAVTCFVAVATVLDSIRLYGYD